MKLILIKKTEDEEEYINLEQLEKISLSQYMDYDKKMKYSIKLQLYGTLSAFTSEDKKERDDIFNNIMRQIKGE